MDFLWKSQRFGESLKTFGLEIFFSRFIKSIGCYGYLAVLNCFINVSFKVITNFKFYNAALSQKTFGSIFVLYDGVLCGKEIHRLGP